MNSGTVLVVGSYPPVPVAGAPVTISEVRRAWAEGDEVVVCAPRLCAAHLAVPVHGLLAGRRLEQVRQATGARRVVLVVEDGLPCSLPGGLLQVAVAAVLVPALGRFEHVRLVRVRGTRLAGPAWRKLAGAAHEVTEADGGPTAVGVTVLGPPEVALSERPRQVAGVVARKMLGRRAPLVRARLGAARARVMAAFRSR